MKYANDIVSGRKVACKNQILCCKRFLKDLENPEYEFNPKNAEFVIGIIEKTFCHQQGEKLDGTPLRGTPFLLEPFHKFIVYNLVGFYHKGTDIVRFHEALIYIPRKNIKTSFAGALAYALGLLYRKSGSKIYITAAALAQTLESFNFIKYNIVRMGEEDSFRIIDNNNEHSISTEFEDGLFFVRALAANPDAQDSFNCNIAIADEIHAFKKPKQYNLFKEAMKAYTNKLMIGITTAGDDMNSFCYHRLTYCKKVLNGTVKDEQYFIFICEADPDESGDIDYTNPIVHEMANPAYGVSIRPNEILNDSLQAQNDPQQRKDFYAKSLNVYTSALKAYFDLYEFQVSNHEAEKALGIDPLWPLQKKIEFVRKLLISFYGGSDLSKLHDLTAGSLYGSYKDIDIILPHCWFPIVAAHRKADEDNIPLFGWKDDGWLTMSNYPTVNHAEIINWYKDLKKQGFKIKQIGHDRKFCREYFIGMQAAGFKIVDQPQYFYKKSEGFRRIEKKAKNKQLYYFGAEPFEYCVQNVLAIEKTDDMIQYEKVEEKSRIDVFDAAVFACVRMLEDLERSQNAKGWLD
ncbi:terminase large subunit [Pseudobacteroides cellulosolvens]|nr:terminase large subunit [Pseudobacteroides cellulosolvens]